MNEQDKEEFYVWAGSRRHVLEGISPAKAWTAACEYKNAQIAELEQQLAECQAREAKLREVLSGVEIIGQFYEESSSVYFACPECEARERNDHTVSHDQSCGLGKALAQPQDRSALDAMLAQARHNVLMEAAELLGRVDVVAGYTVGNELRRMAEEQLK